MPRTLDYNGYAVKPRIADYDDYATLKTARTYAARYRPRCLYMPI